MSSIAHATLRKPYETFETIINQAPAGANLINVRMANITLQDGGIAECLAEDFDSLMPRGVSDRWFRRWNGKKHRYVSTTWRGFPNKTFSVARLIMRCGAGTRLQYIDGNPLNLRRSNLKISEGYSKGLEAAALDEIRWE